MNLRLDRAGTLYLVGPSFRRLSGKSRKIPILMYHSVADEDESATGPYYRISITPSQFLMQMTALHDQGYRTLSLAAAVDQLHGSETSTAKAAVITFDDGYRNFCQNAFPVLEQFGFTATMFLPTASIADRSRIFNGRECMTWTDVREMQDRGIDFGSHTVTHPQLYGQDRESIRAEILHSRLTIEDKVGIPVDSFAYPYAFPQTDASFKAMLRDILEQSGFQHGVCTQIGRAGQASDPLFLERIPVNGADDPALLEAKMRGDYDWVGAVQSVVKRTRMSFKRS